MVHSFAAARALKSRRSATAGGKGGAVSRPERFSRRHEGAPLKFIFTLEPEQTRCVPAHGPSQRHHTYMLAHVRAHTMPLSPSLTLPHHPPTHTYTLLCVHTHIALLPHARAHENLAMAVRVDTNALGSAQTPWCSSACPCRALWDQLMGLCTWLAQTALRQPTRRRERVPGERRVAGQAGQHARSRQPHRRRARAQPPHTRYAHAHMRTAMRTCAKQARGPPPGLRSPPPVASTGLREKQPASSRNSVLARSRSRSRSHHYLAEGSKIPRDGLLPLVLGVCGICFAFEHISRCCAMLPTLAQTAKS